MAKAKSATADVPERAPLAKVLRRTIARGRTPAEDTATIMVEGIAPNTLATQMYSSMLPETDTTEAFALSLSLAERVSSGDRSALDAVLAAQVITCNAIFTDCVKRARQNYQNVEVHDRLMRIGLRAQNQCRATVESLALMQNPPAVFARQANIANGPQQINNSALPRRVARVRETQPPPNELLEQYGKRLDTASPKAAIGGDQVVATMGAIDGPKNRTR